MSEHSILIAGCGDIGTRLGLQLVAGGRTVIGLRRDPSRLPPGITRFPADLSAPATLRELPRDIEDIVYIPSAGSYSDESWREAYVTGLRHLLAATPTPRRLVYISSTSVYPQDDGSWVDVDSVTGGDSFSAQRLLEGEAVARTAGGTSLRLSGIYGPGRTMLIDMVRNGTANYLSTRTEYTNRIHADDAAGALAHILALASPDPTYLATDDAPSPRQEVLTWLATRLKAAPPRAVDELPPSSRRFRSSKRCTNRALRETGWAPQYPSYREGYAALISTIRERPS